MSSELKDPDGGWIHYDLAQLWGVARDVSAGELGIGSWTSWTWLEQLLTLLELTLCTACLTTQLALIQRCALIEIGGLSLALRGPDGSAQKALHHMRLEVRRCQRMMIRGVQFLAVTILVLLLKDLPLPMAVLPFLISLGRFAQSKRHQDRLTQAFELPADVLQSSSPWGAPEWRRARLQRMVSAAVAARKFARKQWFRWVCCEDDTEAELLERSNSRPRTTAEAVRNLIFRNQGDVRGGGGRRPKHPHAPEQDSHAEGTTIIDMDADPEEAAAARSSQRAAGGASSSEDTASLYGQAAGVIQRIQRGKSSRRKQAAGLQRVSQLPELSVSSAADHGLPRLTASDSAAVVPVAAVPVTAVPVRDPMLELGPLEKCLRSTLNFEIERI